MSTDIFETATDGTGTVRAAFDATAAECRPDIDALTRRALDRGQRVRRHRTVGKAVGSAAAAAAIGLGTVYALNDSGTSARPANVPGTGTGAGTAGIGTNTPASGTTPPSPAASITADPTTVVSSVVTSLCVSASTVTLTASLANAVASCRATRHGTSAVLPAAA